MTEELTVPECTHTIPVLCLYEIKTPAYGWISDGAKMIHVARSLDILPEFEIQMRKALKGHDFVRRGAVAFRLVKYLPYCDTPFF